MTGEHVDIEELSAFLAGDLDDRDHDAVAAHVADCDACAGELDGLRATLAALASLATPTMPEDVARRLTQRLETETKAKTGAGSRGGDVLPLVRRRRAPLILSAAASVLVVALGVTFFVTRDKPGRSGADVTTASAPEADVLVVEHSGFGYSHNEAQIGEHVTSLLRAPATDAAGGSGTLLDRGATPTPPQDFSAGGTGGGAEAPVAGPKSAKSLQLTTMDQAACVATTTSGSDAKALLVDYGFYDGQPALIVVTTDQNPDKLSVFILKADCATNPVSIPYLVARVDR
jgi:anti-sigma factor RsiW